jgi:hypothetical protein
VCGASLQAEPSGLQVPQVPDIYDIYIYIYIIQKNLKKKFRAQCTRRASS